MVKLLLDRGADAGPLDKDGRMPLHHAVIVVAQAAGRYNNGSRRSTYSDNDSNSGSGETKEAEKTLRLLLQAQGAGADPRALDHSGRSVLFTAVAAGSEAAVEIVLGAIGCESLADSSSSSSSSSGSTWSASSISRRGIQVAQRA
ncbi:hypothetical protein F5884DRAFT_784959 [Xylogone sp. PMI_703]|nr:hypothetical protein F5884DRAFT_784959 [Xylogone sp. PMI_703]